MDLYNLVLSAKLIKGEGGGDISVDSLSVTENGTYTAEEGHAYSPVTVNVPSVTPTGNVNITSTAQTDVSAYATAQVVDADLVASNIKKDVDILGVVGTYEGGGGGGSGGKSAQIANSIGMVNSGLYVDTGLNLTVAKSGVYNVYWVGWRTSLSGTSGAQLVIDGTDYGEAQETFDSSSKSVQCPCISNVSLTEGQVVSLKGKAYNMQYKMFVMNLTIIEV